MKTSYEYLIGLKLVHPNPSKELNDFENIINLSAQEYNHICMNRSTNPKEITIREITGNTIILKLNSRTELSSPGKALRSFSQLLIKHSEFAKCFVFGKQLFTSFEVTSENSAESNTHITADDIDDTLFMGSMLSYFLNKRDSDSTTYVHKRKAVEKMKLLAYECGIITLNK